MGMFMSTNKVAGMALMLGTVLLLGGPLLTQGSLSTETDDIGDFREFLEPIVDAGALAHVSTMIMMLGVALMAFGASSLLRLPRRPGLSDFSMRFGVGTMLFAWGVLIVEMGLRHMSVHIVAHGIYPDMDQSARDVMGLTIFTTMAGMEFGLAALSVVWSTLVGLWLVIRFDGFNLFVLAGYGLIAKGVAELFNIVFVQHLHGVDFALVFVITSVLMYIGGLWLIIIGYGIFRERPELVSPEGEGG